MGKKTKNKVDTSTKPTETKPQTRKLFMSKKFDSDMKLVRKYPKYDETLFKSLIDKLLAGEKLDDKYKDHKMASHSAKGLDDCREFHLAPNILVIYRLTNAELELVRIGSHSTLFEDIIE